MLRVCSSRCARVLTRTHSKHRNAISTTQRHITTQQHVTQHNTQQQTSTTTSASSSASSSISRHLASPLSSLITSATKARTDAPRLIPAFSISHDATLLEALERFVALPYNSLPLLVLDDQQFLIGMITQRDIVDQIVDLKAANRPWSSTTVQSIMTKARDIACLNAQDTLESCLTLMVTGQLQYLPFIDRDVVTGFLSLSSIVASSFLPNAPQSHESVKAVYLRAVKPHLGIPRNTRVQPIRPNASSSIPSTHNNLHIPSKPYMRIAQYQLPHPDKVSTGGEDFIVVCDAPTSTWTSMAVFDGVGSWSFEQGVDVRLFSKSFSEAARNVMDDARRTSSQAVSPAQILSRAWEQVQKADVVGSCTACVVTIQPSKQNDYATLRAISVGDSGFIILRPRSTESQTDSEIKEASFTQSHDDLQSSESGGEFFPISIFIDEDEPHENSRFTVHHRSTQQLHYFNCPYQLGITKTGETSFDRIEDGTDSAAQLLHGDIILLSTDGLWDNLHESTIVEIVESHITNVDALDDKNTTPIVDVAAAAKSLGDRALRQSWDRSVDSPFALLAKDHNIQWGGGRRDDISVVVAQYVGTTS